MAVEIVKCSTSTEVSCLLKTNLSVFISAGIYQIDDDPWVVWRVLHLFFLRQLSTTV